MKFKQKPPDYGNGKPANHNGGIDPVNIRSANKVLFQKRAQKILNGKNILNRVESKTQPTWCYKVLIENVNVGVIVLDLLNERIISQNPAALNLFKNTIKPMDYNGLKNLFFNNLDEELPSAGIKPKSRRLKYGNRSFGFTLHLMEAGFVALFIQDITQKIHLREREKTAQYLDFIDNVFSGIRQEMFPLVKEIKDALNSLEKNAAESHSKMNREFFTKALPKMDKIELLLKGLEYFGDVESMQFEQIDFCSFLKSTIKEISYSIRDKGIKLNTVFFIEDCSAFIDPKFFSKLLLNLICNSMDALKNTNKPEITINAFKTDDYLFLQLEDNGKGIPEYLQERAFHPFYSTKIGSLGLGLTMAKKILAKFNGSITLKSLLNTGTVIEICLPATSNHAIKKPVEQL